MRNFKLNPESPLINLFKGNEDLLDYPVIVSTLAELSNKPLSFRAIEILLFTSEDGKEIRCDENNLYENTLYNKIVSNETYYAADNLIPYIGETLEICRKDPNGSERGLAVICDFWAINGVIDKAYETSVKQSPDFDLLDALQETERDEDQDLLVKCAKLVIAPINKKIALEVLNNGAVYQATVGSQDQSKDDANTR